MNLRSVLQIAPPAVYIKAQQTAERHRKNMCNSNILTSPVRLPQIICVTIPISIILRGLIL